MRKKPKKQLINLGRRIAVQDKVTDQWIKTKLKILPASKRILQSQWMSHTQPTSDHQFGRPLELKMVLKCYGCQRPLLWWRSKGGIWRRVTKNLHLFFGFVSNQCSLNFSTPYTPFLIPAACPKSNFQNQLKYCKKSENPLHWRNLLIQNKDVKNGHFVCACLCHKDTKLAEPNGNKKKDI